MAGNFHFRSELLSDDWEMARGFLVSEFDYLFAALSGFSLSGVSTGSTSGGVRGPSGAVAGHISVFADATGQVLADSGIAAASVALLASPHFTGVPTAPTPATADNSVTIATTAYVQAQGYATTGALGAYLPLTGGTISGNLAVTGSSLLSGVKASGIIRSEGVTTPVGVAGAGAEIAMTSGVAYFQGYDRTALAYVPVQIIGSTVTVTGNMNLVNNLSVSGLFTLSGFGVNQFAGSGAGEQALYVLNSAAGAGNFSTLVVGNDLNSRRCTLSTQSSNNSNGAPFYADGTTLYQTGSNGLALVAASGTGRIELWTNGLKRWIVDSGGAFISGLYSAGSLFSRLTQGLSEIGVAGTGATNAMIFYNPNGAVGTIQTSGTTTTYNTTSDKRLKRDRGIARSTTVLERTEIHDYNWLADGTPGRGVFSQDANAVLPCANAPGTDKQPWQTDYSKYVPDLIVGWQQHAAEIAALRAELAMLKGH
jgi:hypothetical protein